MAGSLTFSWIENVENVVDYCNWMWMLPKSI